MAMTQMQEMLVERPCHGEDNIPCSAIAGQEYIGFRDLELAEIRIADEIESLCSTPG